MNASGATKYTSFIHRFGRSIVLAIGRNMVNPRFQRKWYRSNACPDAFDSIKIVCNNVNDFNRGTWLPYSVEWLLIEIWCETINDVYQGGNWRWGLNPLVHFRIPDLQLQKCILRSLTTSNPSSFLTIITLPCIQCTCAEGLSFSSPQFPALYCHPLVPLATT